MIQYYHKYWHTPLNDKMGWEYICKYISLCRKILGWRVMLYALYYCEKITQVDWLNCIWTFLLFFSPNNFNMIIFKKEKKKYPLATALISKRCNYIEVILLLKYWLNMKNSLNSLCHISHSECIYWTPTQK